MPVCHFLRSNLILYGSLGKGGLISEDAYFDFCPIAKKRCQITLLSGKKCFLLIMALKFKFSAESDLAVSVRSWNFKDGGS